MTRSLNETLAGTSAVDWAKDFLHRAGFPVTPQNVQVVYSWEYAESGGGGGMWNPLNTTQGGYAGETDYNSVGVKNYVTREDGIAANARVIHNGYYPLAVGLFQLGNNAQAIVNAITSSPWGTRHIQLLDVPGEPEKPPVPPPPPDPYPPLAPFPIIISAALAHPGNGAWIATPDARVWFIREGLDPLPGGLTTREDRAKWGDRKVQKLEPRNYGLLKRQHGYRIVATDGYSIVPAAQR